MSSHPTFLQGVDTSQAFLPLSGWIDHGKAKGKAKALWWPSRDGTNSAILIFVPGNPGLSDFYIDFLEHIRRGVKHSSLAILAHSHIGHDAQVAAPEDAPTLKDQVEATCATLDQIRKAFRAPVPVFLMGHSIGSWICMQVMKDRSDAIHTMFALFPTVSNIQNTPNGMKLSWLFNPPLPSLVSSLCPLVAPACPFLLPILFWHWPSHQREVIQRLIKSPSSVFAALTMAHDEMQTVKALDMELLDKLRSRIKWLYGFVDEWVGIHGDELVRHLGREVAAQNIRYADLPHAFCIMHSKETASICTEWLNEVLSCHQSEVTSIQSQQQTV